MNYGKAIHIIRTMKQITQQALADASGVLQTTISRIEKGKNKVPTIDTLKRLAVGLDVSMVALHTLALACQDPTESDDPELLHQIAPTIQQLLESGRLLAATPQTAAR